MGSVYKPSYTKSDKKTGLRVTRKTARWYIDSLTRRASVGRSLGSRTRRRPSNCSGSGSGRSNWRQSGS